jgi:hypothetical protein
LGLAGALRHAGEDTATHDPEPLVSRGVGG